MLNISMLAAHRDKLKTNKAEAMAAVAAVSASIAPEEGKTEAKKAESLEEEKGNSEAAKADVQDVLDLYQQGIVCMLTGTLIALSYPIIALLLSYEQIYRNTFSLNKVVGETGAKRSFSGKESNTCIALSSEIIKEVLSVGLQNANSTEMMIVLLQIAFLLCEQREVFDKEDLPLIMTAVVRFLTNTVSSNEPMEKGTRGGVDICV